VATTACPQYAGTAPGGEFGLVARGTVGDLSSEECTRRTPSTPARRSPRRATARFRH